MAQKTQHASNSDNQPNPASSPNKDLPDAGQNRKQSNSHTPSPPSTSQHPKPINTKDSNGNAGNSQTMTKSTSSASALASKESMAGPSPYGTRSRNRGQARPNYAEDKDMDIEMYDAYPDKKDEEAKKTSRQPAAVTNGATDAAKPTGSASRKSAAQDDGKAGNSHATGNGAKDSHANGSTNATGAGTTTSSNSKKRKAPTQSSTSNAHKESHVPTISASAPTGSKRGASNQTVTSNGRGYRETNLLSFEKSKAFLKDGKLIADDGTELERNGKKHSLQRGISTLLLSTASRFISRPTLTRYGIN